MARTHGEIPREFIRRLSETADIATLVGERVQLQKRGSNLFGLCPFHTEKTPSFSVNPSKGFYHCFGCGANGNALNFVIQLECGGDFVAGVEALAARLGMTVPRSGDASTNEVEDALAEAQKFFRAEFVKSSVARDYLQKRGLSDESAERFGVGFAPPGWDNLKRALRGCSSETLVRAGLLRAGEKEGKKASTYDYFRNRIIFPIMEGAGRVSGFGGRALDDDPAKYLNSPDSPVFSKKRVVFGTPQARTAAREKNRVIVVEGYMDVAMLSQHGFPETVAAMGTALTDLQAGKIARMAGNIVFAFDGDDAGKNAAWRILPNILPALSDGMSVSFLFLPQGEDPDSFVRTRGSEEFVRAIAAAPSLADYMCAQLWARAKGGSEEGRSSAALAEGGKLLRLLNSNRAPFLREVLEQKLSAAAKLSADAVRRASAKSASAGRNQRAARANGRYRMYDTGLLFSLLCCLAARPTLLSEFPENPPLPGSERDSSIVAGTLHYVRAAIDEGEEPDIVAHLAAEGYSALAGQVREYAGVRYGGQAADPAAAFASLSKKLGRAKARKVRSSVVA